MSCSLCCVKFFHYVLNAYYMLLALGTLTLGIWAAVDPGFKSVMQDTEYPVAYIFIGIGVTMTITSIFGDLAVCMLSRILLVLSCIGYSVTVLLFLGTIVWLALSRETLKTKTDNFLGNCIATYKKSNGAITPCSISLDAIQHAWSCCGRVGRTDYLYLGTGPVPASCPDDPVGGLLSFVPVIGGCSSKISASIDQYFTVIMAVAGAHLVIPLALAILTITLYRLFKSDGFAPVRT